MTILKFAESSTPSHDETYTGEDQPSKNIKLILELENGKDREMDIINVSNVTLSNDRIIIKADSMK